MRKKMALGVACAAVLLAAWLLTMGGGIRTADLPRLEPAAGRDFMQASLMYDAGTRTLRGTQTLTAKNRTDAPLTEAVLRLYMNGQSEDSVVVSGVHADGQSVSFEADPDDPTVLRIPLDWQPGQTVTLSWTLMLKHPRADGAAIITLPSLAMHEDGAWRTDAYDALAGQSYARAFDYTLDLIARDDTTAVFGGALTACRWETGVGETLYTAQMQGARDVCFALMSGGKLRQQETNGVLVTALAASSPQAHSLLAQVEQALDDLDRLGFAYPFPSLTIAALSDALQDGMPLSGLIALAPDADGEQLRRQLTRLIARQTFGIQVESDPWNAPWLSQSLAAAAELLCYRQRKGVQAYETRFFEEIEIASRVTRPQGVSVGAGTAFFGSDAEMTQVLRDQGAAMLLGIEGAVGEEAFLAALRAYAQRCAGQTGTREALEQALRDATGSDWSGYLADELSF